MKRHPSLRGLSGDHHHGLVHARRLQKAGTSRAGDRAEIETQQVVRDFLRFFAMQTNRHFREEEEVLLPAFARYGDPAHPSVVRMLVEHVHIRRLVSDLQHQMKQQQLSLETVRDTGALLQAHIRLEENVIFPLIEQTLPDEALVDLAGSVRSGSMQVPCDPQYALSIAQLRLLHAIRLISAGIAGHQSAADIPGVVHARGPFLSTWSGIGSSLSVRQRPGKSEMPTRSSQILSSGSIAA